MIDPDFDIKRRPREHFLSRFNKILLALIAVAVVLPLTYRALPIVKEKNELQVKIAEAEASVSGARMKLAQLKRELMMLNDPAYRGFFLYDQGRGHMRPGETIFRFPRESQR